MIFKDIGVLLDAKPLTGVLAVKVVTKSSVFKYFSVKEPVIATVGVISTGLSVERLVTSPVTHTLNHIRTYIRTYIEPAGS